MPLAQGTRIASYEITGTLGAGGMGQVYRARDTRLDRDVAIKVLPDGIADDPERLTRFEREAKTLAALNHPNIAHVHGVEEASGAPALVMELVDGDDLSARIAIGPMPLDDALPIARQIAEALEAAHRAGIVHRDLKPANIKVRSDGTVKVLDFGLAKALSRSAASPGSAIDSHHEMERPGVSQAVTSPAMTAAGIILGTAAYMAPEQARGIAVDARADIWAFGAVLFEMIAGRRAFEGELTSDVLASVLKTAPQWQELPADTPLALRRLLQRCLEKDPRRRLQAIGDARIEIEDLIGGGAEPQAISPRPPSRRLQAVPWLLSSAAIALALVMLWLWSPWQTAAARPPVRVRADLGADVALATANTGAAAILSPDGAVLAFIGRRTGSAPAQLFIRRLSQLDATPLPGTDGAVNPFFSPDGQWIGFFTVDKLKKVAITGGAAVTLTDAPNSRGGTWTADGTIVFAENRSGLWRVAAAGGAREPLTTLSEGEVTHRHPQVLPGGRSLLYTAHTAADNFDNAHLVVHSLATGTRSVIQRGGYFGRYLASGHLVYTREGTLFAVPFDLDRLVTNGAPLPVLEGVMVSEGRGEAQFAASDDGTLAFFPAGERSDTAPIFWIDRQGQTSLLRPTPIIWFQPGFSPDGHRLAMTIGDGKQEDIWIHEWARDIATRLTLDPAHDTAPVWSPDGRGIAFASMRGGTSPNVFWQRADGTGDPQRLTNAAKIHVPSSWHPSGRFLAFTEAVSGESADVMILPLDGSVDAGWKPGVPSAFGRTRFRESKAKFSPDGRWIAYESAEGGGLQVYVRPFPGPGAKLQISTAGGEEPRWSPSRRELLFHNLDGQIMVAPYTITGDAFRAERARPWSQVRISEPARGFDVHPDGERLVVPPIVQAEDAPRRDQVVLIFNFFDELRRATAKQ